MESLQIFNDDEKNLICSAIYNHSNKSGTHDWLDEILKDADVMQHVLYNPFLDVKPIEQPRFTALKAEFNMEH